MSGGAMLTKDARYIKVCQFSKFALNFIVAAPVVFSSVAFAAPSTTASGSNFDKVFTVVLENGSYDKALVQPFLSSLVSNGVTLSNMSGEVHPSQGNYIAMTSGSAHDVSDDRNVDLDVRNITDLLDARGKTWKIYAEDFPGDCFQGATKGKFARKHVPFLSYVSIQQDPTKCAKIVDASELEADVQNGALADYSFFVPNLSNDGHNTGITFADSYMLTRFGPLLKNPKFMKGMLFITTFDESETHSSNHIYTTLTGSMVKAGAEISGSYNHFSILRMIEDNWDLGTIDQGDSTAPKLEGIWK
jgi:hypothetical protein